MDYIEELVKRVKKGDDAAFTELLGIYQKMIYKLIYNNNLMTGDYMQDVDSLFQEGSLALFDSCYSFEEGKGARFSTYAYMVIRARLNTYIRNNKIMNDDCFSIDNTNAIDYRSLISSLLVTENPIEYHRQKEFERILNEFISNLSKEDKQIVKMRYFDLSYKQISERLKINTKRVDNRLRVLRNKLKSYLEEKNIDI